MSENARKLDAVGLFYVSNRDRADAGEKMIRQPRMTYLGLLKAMNCSAWKKKMAE